MRILWGISPLLAAMTPVATSGPPTALARMQGVLCGGVLWYPTLQRGFARRADDETVDIDVFGAHDRISLV